MIEPVVRPEELALLVQGDGRQGEGDGHVPRLPVVELGAVPGQTHVVRQHGRRGQTVGIGRLGQQEVTT